MAFTIQNTPNDILSIPEVGKYLCIFFPDFMVDVIPEAERDTPLSVLRSRFTMPWGMPFFAQEMADAANLTQTILREGSWCFTPLRTTPSDGYLPELRKNDRSTVALFHKKAVDKQARKPAVIICPGGGYSGLSMDGEGYQYALRMEEAGYRAFVLTYRVMPNRYPKPQKDLALAVMLLRSRADAYGIDPDKILLMGSSAGGHLCASFAERSQAYGDMALEDLKTAVPALYEAYKGIVCRPCATRSSASRTMRMKKASRTSRAAMSPCVRRSQPSSM